MPDAVEFVDMWQIYRDDDQQHRDDKTEGPRRYHYTFTHQLRNMPEVFNNIDTSRGDLELTFDFAIAIMRDPVLEARLMYFIEVYVSYPELWGEDEKKHIKIGTFTLYLVIHPDTPTSRFDPDFDLERFKADVLDDKESVLKTRCLDADETPGMKSISPAIEVAQFLRKFYSGLTGKLKDKPVQKQDEKFQWPAQSHPIMFIQTIQFELGWTGCGLLRPILTHIQQAIAHHTAAPINPDTETPFRFTEDLCYILYPGLLSNADNNRVWYNVFEEQRFVFDDAQPVVVSKLRSIYTKCGFQLLQSYKTKSYFDKDFMGELVRPSTSSHGEPELLEFPPHCSTVKSESTAPPARHKRKRDETHGSDKPDNMKQRKQRRDNRRRKR